MCHATQATVAPTAAEQAPAEPQPVQPQQPQQPQPAGHSDIARMVRWGGLVRMFFNKSLSTMDQNSVAFANVWIAVKRMCIYQNMAFVFNIYTKIT